MWWSTMCACVSCAWRGLMGPVVTCAGVAEADVKVSNLSQPRELAAAHQDDSARAEADAS